MFYFCSDVSVSVADVDLVDNFGDLMTVFYLYAYDCGHIQYVQAHMAHTAVVIFYSRILRMMMKMVMMM